MGEFLGNLLGGAAQGGSSGSMGYGKGNSKQQNTYLGESYGQKPLEDIMGLLAADANQQRAQRNLMFGGGGYGGSFETAAQKAQRAAGQPVDNTKPYGGWGGYGSNNPALTGTPASGGNSTPTPGSLEDHPPVPPPPNTGSTAVPGWEPPTEGWTPGGANPGGGSGGVTNPGGGGAYEPVPVVGNEQPPRTPGPGYGWDYDTGADQSRRAVSTENVVGNNYEEYTDNLGTRTPGPGYGWESENSTIRNDDVYDPNTGNGETTDTGGGGTTGSELPTDLPPWLASLIANVQGEYSNFGNPNKPPGGWYQDPNNPDGMPVNGSNGGGVTTGETGTSDDRSGRPSQFGPQGFNPKMVWDPLTNNYKPIDPTKNTLETGYAGGDAWSTSPSWRPEEPTGGLYGAYTDLAGGNQTEYENSILTDWRDRAEGPMSDLDAHALAAINNYSQTPGRGEDEAYGAYGDMLKGGYSPAEQNAITQQGMAAARAGFESNRDAILRNQARTNNSAGYAANMAKMARGFGETMGSQARQNQIDFANEAQKRKETGASGMLNVAGLTNQRGSTALGARQQFGNDQNRLKETALGGMQGAAGYGRALQTQGLTGLNNLYNQNDPTKSLATAAGIGSAPRETYNETGSASL